METEYERRHADVWPDLIAALKNAGFSNYTLFRRGTEVVAYAECEPTIAEAMGQLESTEVNSRWIEYIRAIMIRAVDVDGRLFTFEEMWHVD
jgi:L-rhamnose mutarotase